MNPTADAPLDTFWQQFYEHRPELEIFNAHSFATALATIEPDNHQHIAPLHQLGLLCISGDDATTFLQGQLSADVNALAVGQTTMAAHCDAKGRMHTNFLLHKVAEQHYWLQLHNSTAELECTALAKYAVFSKVVIKNLSTQYACFGLESLAHAKDILAHEAIQTAITKLAVDDLLTCIWIPRDKLDNLLEALEQTHTHWLGSGNWQKIIMQRGVGFIEHSNSGEFIPQMLNLDCIHGISFTKGCYTGQEIIARMKYRGSVKRRCWGFSAELSSFEITQLTRIEAIDQFARCAAAGAEIRNSNDQVAGQVVNSVVNSLGAAHGLVVIKLSMMEAEAPLHLCWTDTQGNKLTIPITLTPPPYAIPNN